MERTIVRLSAGRDRFKILRHCVPQNDKVDGWGRELFPPIGAARHFPRRGGSKRGLGIDSLPIGAARHFPRRGKQKRFRDRFPPYRRCAPLPPTGEAKEVRGTVCYPILRKGGNRVFLCFSSRFTQVSLRRLVRFASCSSEVYFRPGHVSSLFPETVGDNGFPQPGRSSRGL